MRTYGPCCMCHVHSYYAMYKLLGTIVNHVLVRYLMIKYTGIYASLELLTA